MYNFVKLQLSQLANLTCMWCKKVVLVHQHTQFYYKITNATYMFMQNRGFGCTNIFQSNNQSHKCNMYVVQNGVWVHHILQNIIEICIALYNNIIKPQIIYNDRVQQVQSNIKQYK
jgi:hypothetical protein